MAFAYPVCAFAGKDGKETTVASRTPTLYDVCRTARDMDSLILNSRSAFATNSGRGPIAHKGYVKSLVYADKPQTLDHLEDNIRRVIADIRPQMLEKVIENWASRLDYIRASCGSHMPEIIFKMTVIRNAVLDLNGLQSLATEKKRYVTRMALVDRAATSRALSQEFGSFARQQVSA
ncbi:hypothetical protein TNCV_3037791 [Trichonephila clavipes]|nr:hypothetical protein TNCV_3037791 [Trichonephila clavipes]